MKLKIFSIIIVILLIVQSCNITFNSEELTKEFEITTEWKTIQLNTPLTARGKFQYISVDVDSISNWDVNSKNGHFISPSGEIIHIKIKLIDEYKNEYFLKSPILSSTGIGLSYLPTKTTKDGYLGLPKSTSFTTIYIKSNIKIQTKKITYNCSEGSK